MQLQPAPCFSLLAGEGMLIGLTAFCVGELNFVSPNSYILSSDFTFLHGIVATLYMKCSSIIHCAGRPANSS